MNKLIFVLLFLSGAAHAKQIEVLFFTYETFCGTECTIVNYAEKPMMLEVGVPYSETHQVEGHDVEYTVMILNTADGFEAVLKANDFSFDFPIRDPAFFPSTQLVGEPVILKEGSAYNYFNPHVGIAPP